MCLGRRSRQKGIKILQPQKNKINVCLTKLDFYYLVPTSVGPVHWLKQTHFMEIMQLSAKIIGSFARIILFKVRV